MRAWWDKQGLDRSGLIRTFVGAGLSVAAAQPVEVGAAPATLTVAAQQHLVQQYCGVCHNYDDYAGGVEFEVFGAAKAHESAALTERMLKKLRAGMMPPAGKPRPDFNQAERFGDSTGPLQNI